MKNKQRDAALGWKRRQAFFNMRISQEFARPANIAPAKHPGKDCQEQPAAELSRAEGRYWDMTGAAGAHFQDLKPLNSFYYV